MTDAVPAPIVLSLQRFPSSIEARKAFRRTPCIYVQTSGDETLPHVGEGDDLWLRHKGGTAYTLDATGHGAGVLCGS